MADDGDDDNGDRLVRRLPQDQLDVLVEALERGQAREVAPYATGESAKVLRKTTERLVNERGFVSEDRIAILISDANERFYERRIRPLEEKMQQFVPNSGIDRKIVEAFGSIGLKIDEEHKEATGNSMRELVRWQGRLDKVIGGAALAVLASVFYAVLRLIGINVPMPGGHS